MRITEFASSKQPPLFEGLDARTTRSAMLWEGAGRMIKEARLTSDQIAQLFKQVTSGGDSDDTKSSQAVKAAWSDLKSKADQSGPVDNLDEKLDKLAVKLAKTTDNSPKIKSIIDKYRAFSEKYPAAQGVIYSALVAAAGISAAGLGVGAALGLLALSDKLIAASKDNQQLSAGEVRRVMEAVANEGAMDFMKNAYGKLKGFVTGASDPANRLKAEWEKAGSPTQSKAVKRFLRAQGISGAKIDSAMSAITGNTSKPGKTGTQGSAPQRAFSKMSRELSGDAAETPKSTKSSKGAAAFSNMASNLAGDDADTKAAPGASAFGAMAGSLASGKQKGTKPHPGISKAEIKRRWVQYLKNNQIVGMAPAVGGKMDYTRRPTTDDVENFLGTEGDYTENEIQNAIRHVSGRARLTGTTPKKVDVPPATDAKAKKKSPAAPPQASSVPPPEGKVTQPPVKGAAKLKANIAKRASAPKTPPVLESIKDISGIPLTDDQIEEIFAILLRTRY